jgi:predicted transcriptional regulator
MARTTLVLDDSQMARLKDLARAQGRTMTDLINQFIAEGLAARTASDPERALSLPIFDMGRPRVNLADREALEAIME